MTATTTARELIGHKPELLTQLTNEARTQLSDLNDQLDDLALHRRHRRRCRRYTRRCEKKLLAAHRAAILLHWLAETITETHHNNDLRIQNNDLRERNNQLLNENNNLTLKLNRAIDLIETRSRPGNNDNFTHSDPLEQRNSPIKGLNKPT